MPKKVIILIKYKALEYHGRFQHLQCLKDHIQTLAPK